ncbi:tail fiber protein [Leptolyngbya sp. NK1-12]|uniref:Tail fiber protein n=1 Tax=Leptolyngbya sp. NK1-12 TaxID=2547451 RepID=A0AA96WM46_9CYAN|nr:hypothetical protein [Leptolyngbya sp. NK1-12]WNZ27754.1 tail fiber protein [Leptolyngbya sp. NK1-12]
MDTIQRLNYFTSQFLVENDFQDEQSYHRNMRLLHNKSLHTFGVVNGLTVTQVGNQQIKVSAGMAIDKNGQEIVLLSDSDTFTLSGNNTDVFVTLQYTESPDVPDTTSGLTNRFRRTTERFQIASSTTKPAADGSVIQVARVTVDSSGNIQRINNDDRILAGAAIAPNSIRTDQLADGSITAAKIANAAVGTSALADNSITAAKIADGSVRTSELANGAVTADKLDPALQTQLSVSGMILMWTGSVNNVPAGWALCNGQNGTPDLRERFIMGLSTDNDSRRGGQATHSHAVPATPQTNTRDVAPGSNFGMAINIHTHTTDVQSNLPPFFKLAFIMKL